MENSFVLLPKHSQPDPRQNNIEKIRENEGIRSIIYLCRLSASTVNNFELVVIISLYIKIINTR